MKRVLPALGLCAAIAACGSHNGPTAPSPLQLAGIWTMTETRASVTGGECLEGAFQPTVGTASQNTMTFTQSGTVLTATSTTQSNGVTCFWTGTADTARFALTLTSCQSNANQFGLRCANGNLRDLRIAQSGITVSVSGAGFAGTKGDIYNVVVAGTQTQVGTLTVNSNIAMSK